MLQLLWEMIGQFFKTLNRITVEFEDSTPGHVSQRTRSRDSKRRLDTHVLSNVIHGG